MPTRLHPSSGSPLHSNLSPASAARSSSFLQHVAVWNIRVLALQPILVLAMLVVTGEFFHVPVWGRGIVLTWGIFPALWVVIGVAKSERPPRFRQAGFLASTFVFPLVSALLSNDSVPFAALSIASANALGAGLAMGLVLVTGPFFEIDITNMRVEQFRVRSRTEIAAQLDLVMVGVALFILTIATLPVIAAELTYVRASNLSLVSLMLRYVTLWPEIFVLYGLILRESIYAHRRAVTSTSGTKEGGLL